MKYIICKEDAVSGATLKYVGSVCNDLDAARIRLDELRKQEPSESHRYHLLALVESAQGKLDPFFTSRYVLQPWTAERLTLMMQSVLITACRGPDGMHKNHVSKVLLRWLRRSFMISAFAGRVIDNPWEDDGGSFTGPVPPGYSIDQAVTDYFKSVDEVPHHFHLHLVHAAEILGRKHPDNEIRAWWYQFYQRAVNDMHLRPELEADLDRRLGDRRETWLAAEEVTADPERK